MALQSVNVDRVHAWLVRLVDHLPCRLLHLLAGEERLSPVRMGVRLSGAPETVSSYLLAGCLHLLDQQAKSKIIKRPILVAIEREEIEVHRLGGCRLHAAHLWVLPEVWPSVYQRSLALSPQPERLAA